MQHEVEREGQPNGIAEAETGPGRMDPAEVQRSIRELSGRIHQLEDQARQVSAPFLMESVLRETGEMRLQSVRAAEQTYNEAVQAAELEAHRLLNDAEQQAAYLLEQAEAEGQRQAVALLDEARQEAGRIRRGAIEQQTQTRHELERVSLEFNTFVRNLLERTAGEHAESEAVVQQEPEPPLMAVTFAAPAVEEQAVEAKPAIESEPVYEPVSELAAAPVHAEIDKQQLTVAAAPAPAPFVAPAPITTAPEADWGADWAEQLKQMVPFANEVEEQSAPAAIQAPVAEDKPATDGFKLPSWLPKG